MKKLVVKCHLDDQETFDRRAVKTGLEFGPAIWQHERVYLPHDFRPGMNHPRLVMRTEVLATDQPAQYAMYLKRHIEDSGVDYVYYTSVGDYTEATGIIHQLGFRKVSEVSRQRREARLDDNTVFYLDVVEGLAGDCLTSELELVEDVPIEGLRQDLYRTLGLLGQKTFLMQTYAELMLGQMQPYYLPE